MDSFERTKLQNSADPAQTFQRTRSEVEVEAGDSVTIPLIEEQVVLDKRIIETGKVRLHKTVQEFEQQLDEPLAVNTFDIERVILTRSCNSRRRFAMKATPRSTRWLKSSLCSAVNWSSKRRFASLAASPSAATPRW